MAPTVAGVKKIAVLRANALGDLLFTYPAFEAVKAAYPAAELVLLANPWHARLLAGRPGPVDRVVVIPISDGLRVEPGQTPDPALLAGFFEQMQAEQFDVALQLHGGGRQSNPFVLRLGARLTVGQRTPDAAPLDRWLPYQYYQNEVARHLETASLIGARPVGYQPRFAVTPADERELAEVFPNRGERFVVVHPGASDPRRRWPPENFAQVGDHLARQGWQVVVTGTAGERAIVDHVLQAMACGAVDLTGALTQGGLAALVARAALVVANDTGPAHLARAVGTPTVSVYWGPNLINSGPLNRAQDYMALSWQMTCPVCGYDHGLTFPYSADARCPHTDSLVAGVPVAEVAGAADALLQQTAGANSA